jgi:LysR family transcriptional activator of mexEF-oprN operon
MNENYGRDLDLNLLRVFVVVVEAGSVTAAAARLYLTQPAVSAALKRLTTAVGAPVLARQGRGLVLTTRGRRLLEQARPHLQGLVGAALSPERFDQHTSTQTLRLGLTDINEAWLLPPLLRRLEREAPGLRLIVVPVQFRTVGEALRSERIDVAVTVADELPKGVHREPLFAGSFVVVADARHARLGKRPSLERYLAHEHVVVSYNGDLRGVVEDTLGIQRRVRCSVASFASLGAIVEGTALVATVPRIVAREMRRGRPHLQILPTPMPLDGGIMELLWRSAVDDDGAVSFLRGLIRELAVGATAT